MKFFSLNNFVVILLGIYALGYALLSREADKIMLPNLLNGEPPIGILLKHIFKQVDGLRTQPLRYSELLSFYLLI